jgi:hypothetical protein
VFDDVTNVDIDFVRNCKREVDYQFKQQLSPMRMLEFIENYFKEKEVND